MWQLIDRACLLVPTAIAWDEMGVAIMDCPGACELTASARRRYPRLALRYGKWMRQKYEGTVPKLMEQAHIRIMYNLALVPVMPFTFTNPKAGWTGKASRDLISRAYANAATMAMRTGLVFAVPRLGLEMKGIGKWTERERKKVFKAFDHHPRRDVFFVQ